MGDQSDLRVEERVAVAWGGPEARNRRLGGCLCRCHYSGPDGCLEGKMSLGDVVVCVVCGRDVPRPLTKKRASVGRKAS